MFVEADDFDVPPFNIPNLKQVANTFPLYIEERERRILSKILGPQLYNDLIAGLDALPPLWEPAPVAYNIDDLVLLGVTIWKSLVDGNTSPPVEGIEWTKVEDNKWMILKQGYEYTYGGESFVWVGLKRMLKPYIYSQWLSDTYDTYTGIGVVESRAENANVVAPDKRIVKAYNEFAFMAGTSDDYEGYNEYYGYYGYYPYGYNSLAGFLYTANILTVDTYPNWNFYDVGTMNTFGL